MKEKIEILLRRAVGPGILAVFLLTVLISFLGYEIPAEMLILNVVLIVGFFVSYTITEGLTFYVARRIGQTVFVLWVISTLCGRAQNRWASPLSSTKSQSNLGSPSLLVPGLMAKSGLACQGILCPRW